MAATERPLGAQEKCEIAESEAKTIFSILSKLKDNNVHSNNQSDVFVSETKVQLENDDDILILRKDPKTNRKTINRTAYLKLHRSLSPNRSSTIEKIKENYEKTDDETPKNDSTDSAKPIETIESLKDKYSPTGLGYGKPQPAPKPRRSKLSKSQIITPSKRDQARTARFSLNIEKNKHKDVNSNNLQQNADDLSSEEEFVTIITRSDSEESILRFQKELSAFTMDKKKRVNSFRRIFSVFNNKDKKKKQEEKNKSQNKENGETYSDNFQNESNSFNRQSTYRHTTGGETKPINKTQRTDSDVKVPNNYNEEELAREYAEMHLSQFNKYKDNLEQSLSPKPDPIIKVTNSGYTPMDRPIYKSNGTNNPYMNMPNVRKYIDTSSSASTLESDRSNIYQNEVLFKASQPKEEEVEIRTYPPNSFRPNRITDGRRDTPPRLLETKQDVRLVNPKALIPINSERPLPNPYQNENRESPRGKPLSQSTPKGLQSPYLSETYGTVLDSLENRQKLAAASPRERDKPPRSPSVEQTKLKLPPNREIVPLSPRIRSPIPPDNVSTEKIIATELLKPKRSPTPTKKGAKEEVPSHQRLEIDIDYPDNLNYSSRDSLMRSADNLLSKPPIVARPIARRPPEDTSQASRSSTESVVLRNRVTQISPMDNHDRITTNAQVHINSPLNRTPTPSNSLSSQNLSLSPVKPANINIRPSTPSGSQIQESPKTTPQKEDIRKSVEAYYWKEIKKLKDQENYDLYLMQMRYGNMPPYGYAEDPISVRRSRSMSPSANRDGRRSLSLPRETRPPTNIIPEKYYPSAIPENRAVTNQMQPRSVQQLQFQQQQYFLRNAPERNTIDGSPRNTNSLYRPIFKRGSLSTPPRQLAEDSLKRKVSFSGAQDQNVQAWPSKNGYVQNPPQRRIDKPQSQGEDDVFLPNIPKVVNDIRYRYPDPNAKIDLPNEEMYYNTRQNIIRPNTNGDSTYVLRASQNSLYLQPRQPIENPYGQRLIPNPRRFPNQQEEVLYGQPIDAVKHPGVHSGLTRYGSVQIQEELYGQRPGPRRVSSYQNNPSLVRPSVASTPIPAGQEVQYVPRRPASQQGVQPLRREIIVNDEIFGQFGGYSGPNNNIRVVQPQNVYASRQSIADYNARVRDEYYSRQPQKQVSVSNKVCDIYGQIHDAENQKVQQSGVLMGQLYPNPSSPTVVRNSYTQLAGRDNFLRNGRLTASANDMYRRVQNVPQPQPKETLYGRIEQNQTNANGAPTRPLPPVPQKKGAAKSATRNNIVSDTESGSDASEIQRILNNNSKTKRRGIFSK